MNGQELLNFKIICWNKHRKNLKEGQSVCTGPSNLRNKKIEKEVNNAKFSVCSKNLKASSDNLSVFSNESSSKDFNSNNSFEYPIKTIPKVISKSKSTSLNKTSIKNVCDTL